MKTSAIGLILVPLYLLFMGSAPETEREQPKVNSANLFFFLSNNGVNPSSKKDKNSQYVEESAKIGPINPNNPGGASIRLPQISAPQRYEAVVPRSIDKSERLEKLEDKLEGSQLKATTSGKNK